MLVGVLQQIADGMKELQVLFKSSRRRRKVLKVEPLLDRIHQIYRTLIDQRHIRYRKVTRGRSPLTASTTDGVIMQVLINLFDNACYWLEAVDSEARQICVTVDADQGNWFSRTAAPASILTTCRTYSSRSTPARGRRDVAWACTSHGNCWSGTTTASRWRTIGDES